MNTKAEFETGRRMRLTSPMAVVAGCLLFGLGGFNSAAQTYRVLHNFDGADGALPFGNLLLSGSALYGTAIVGGDFNHGTVFKLEADGSNFKVLKSFAGGSDGGNPYAGLMQSGPTLFGTTEQALNDNGSGTVYSLDTNGGGYETLTSLRYANGMWPDGGLVMSGSTLYGAAGTGGDFGYGTIYKVQADGTGYARLKSFTGSDGAYPRVRLVLSGTTLYGTASEGGITNSDYTYGCGTVFSIKTDGSGFTVLKYFDGSEGNFPAGELVLSGTTLYGVTGWSGNGTNYGTLFQLGTDGSGFSVIKRFGWGNELSPTCLLLSGSTLYGMTSGLYQSFYGTVFSINTNGTGYSVLKQFVNSDGANPGQSLMMSGGVLFGTAIYGGNSNQGVVFALGYPPAILKAPQTQTAEAGGVAAFSVRADPSIPATCLWFFNGTNLSDAGTGAWLMLTNVQSSHAGTYTVIVSNLFGTVTSAPAALSVIPLVERRPVPAINMTGQMGTSWNIEGADLFGAGASWVTLDTVRLNRLPQTYFDISLPLPARRFYRLRQIGDPAAVPSLSIPGMVPAITLTGNAGDVLKLDYINAIGPTDAWMTLGVVTLTSSSQLYFDASSIGEPRRLYRIEPAP